MQNKRNTDLLVSSREKSPGKRKHLDEVLRSQISHHLKNRIKTASEFTATVPITSIENLSAINSHATGIDVETIKSPSTRRRNNNYTIFLNEESSREVFSNETHHHLLPARELIKNRFKTGYPDFDVRVSYG